MKTPIFRIAPSPTGEMHIGTVGMALCDYMLARTMGGKCYLRIEDTDQKREVKGATERLLKSFKKFGIHFDNQDNIAVQSTRGEIYKKYAEELIAKNQAYRDDGAIRFRAPKTTPSAIKWKDLVKGEMALPPLERDPVIMKSNGLPPYNLAATVDDYLMGVTHVLRGEEWLVSTAEHIQLRQAVFGESANWQYAHLPVICIEEDGKKRKLSKRKDKEALAEHFLGMGYPADAVIEYLLTLYNTDFELWRIKNPDIPWHEFNFRFEKIGSNSPLFDWNKLDNISRNVIAKMSCEQVREVFGAWAAEHNISQEDTRKGSEVLCIDRGQSRPRKDVAKWSDVLTLYSYLFKDEGIITDKAVINDYKKTYDPNDSKDEWFAKIKKYCEESGKSVRDVTGAIRMAYTGRENTPDLWAILKIINQLTLQI